MNLRLGFGQLGWNTWCAAADLHRRNQLLFPGEHRLVESNPVTAEEPETAASADDLCGVRATSAGGGGKQSGLRAVPVQPDRSGDGITVSERAADPDPQCVVFPAGGLQHPRLSGSADRVGAIDPGTGGSRTGPTLELPLRMGTKTRPLTDRPVPGATENKRENRRRLAKSSPWEAATGQ